MDNLSEGQIVSGGGEMTVSDLIQIILMGLLIAITGIYVWRTHVISKATKEQAGASVKMAEKMEEQLLSEARPYLLIRLAHEIVQWDNTEDGKQRPTEFPVTIRNEGKGPAIEVEASLWHPQKVHPHDSKGYLAPGEEWQTTVSRLDVGIPREGEEEVRPWLPELRAIIKQNNPGAVVVVYHDIHKRTWVTYLLLERHVDLPEFVMEGGQNIVESKK